MKAAITKIPRSMGGRIEVCGSSSTLNQDEDGVGSSASEDAEAALDTGAAFDPEDVRASGALSMLVRTLLFSGSGSLFFQVCMASRGDSVA